MEVNYKTKINGGNYYDSYEILEKKYCCEKMQKMFEDKYYKYGLDVFRLEGSHFTDIDETELEFSLVEYHLEINSCGEGYELTDYNHHINFCPFCGDKIVLNEVKRVKVVKHVKKVPKTICEEVVVSEEEIEV